MVLVIKKKDRLDFVESWDYSKDKQEKSLHKLIEQNPEFIIGTEEESKPVITIGSNMTLPGGELDLLFVDNEGSLTLVELKRGRAPRKVIAQILDYASSLSEMSLDELENSMNGKFTRLKDAFDDFERFDLLPAPEFSFPEFRDNVKSSLRNIRLFITSYSITEDIKRVTRWLRENYSVPILCVEFEYFRKGDQEFFMPRIIGEETPEKRRGKRKITPMQKKYYKFFDDVLQEFKKKKRGVTDRGSTYDSWLPLPSGYGNSIHFEWLFSGREPNKTLGIEIHFENTDKSQNLKLLKHFTEKKEELEKEIGESLAFEEWGKNWSRIYAARPVGTIEQGIENEEAKNWAVDTMINFYDTFKPKLDEFVPTMK